MGMPPVDLRVLLNATAASLWASFAESAASARPDHKGGPREARVRQFLRDRLPSKWGVTRGHMFFANGATSSEFDVIIYDALNCPKWLLDVGEDPRSLVPLEAVIGIIEVKSTLNQRTLDAAINKVGEFDRIQKEANCDGKNRPFRFVFAYTIDVDDGFGGWTTPSLYMTSYAGNGLHQPDGVFILDSHLSILAATQSVERAFALHWGIPASEVWDSNVGVQQEYERRDINDDPSHCLDYFWTPAKDGFLLLAFLTFVLEGGEAFQAPEISYADRFCTWGGPRLGELVEYHGKADPDLPTV